MVPAHRTGMTPHGTSGFGRVGARGQPFARPNHALIKEVLAALRGDPHYLEDMVREGKKVLALTRPDSPLQDH